MTIPAKPTEKEPTDMLEGMGKESAELIARLNEIVKSYTAAEWDLGGVPRICSDAATALAAKDAEIAGLREALEKTTKIVKQQAKEDDYWFDPGSILAALAAKGK